ncbi:unnamed protein product [Lampetra planeri]
MTSLANQLRRLALPQTDQSLLMRKERASLLFDPKEAASLDGDFFHAIGCTGLEELSGIEPAFDDFRDTLFSEASKRMERSVQSRDVNARLDESIALFLARLSPFFLLRPAHKCLEWLLYRFHIHQYNTEALIGCVLPYHETKVFVRVVQLLKISEPTHRWHWLHPLQKPGVPLSRSTLVMHCYKDLGFMDFICGLVTHAVQVFGEQPSAACQLRVLFSFYSSTLVAALEADRVTDTVVAKLLPHVQKGLRSGLTDYWASSLMLVAQLAVRATLEESLAETLTLQLVRSLARRHRDAETRDGVACLIVLLQTQPSRTLKKKPFDCLCSLDGLLETLQELGATHDTAPLLRAFLPPLVSAALHPVLTPNDDDDGEAAKDLPAPEKLLLRLVQDIPLDRGIDTQLIRLLLEGYMRRRGAESAQEEEEGGASDGLAVLHQRLLPILRTLEKRYTESWDQVMAAHLHGESAGTGKEAFHDFISLGAASGKHQLVPDSDTSLLLSLHHPQEAVRCLALSHLCTLVLSGKEGFGEEFLTEAVCSRLHDDTPAVVTAALTALTALAGRICSVEAISVLVKLIHKIGRQEQHERWRSVFLESVRVLTSQGAALADSQRRDSVALELLPYALPLLAPRDLAPALAVAQSPLARSHPLLRGLDKVLSRLNASSKKVDPESVGTVEAIKVLAQNLVAMDPVSREETVEQLLARAQLRDPAPRQQLLFHATVLMLTEAARTVDPGERSSKGAGEGSGEEGAGYREHLHLAVRAFRLLEERLNRLPADNFKQEAQDLPSAMAETGAGGLLVPAFVARMLCAVRNGAGELDIAFVYVHELRGLVTTLQPPRRHDDGLTWWNVESLDEATRGYLCLLVGLFDVVVAGATEGTGDTGAAFRQLLFSLLQVHLPSASERLRFLGLVWSSACDHSRRLGRPACALMQARALHVGAMLLGAAPDATPTAVAVPAMVSLLAALSSPLGAVRAASLRCVRALLGPAASAASATPLQPLAAALLASEEEIVADSAHTAQALGLLFESQAKEGRGRGDRHAAEALAVVLTCMASTGFPSYVARAALHSLEHVHGPKVLSLLLPVLERLLLTLYGRPCDGASDGTSATGSPAAAAASSLHRDEELLAQLVLAKFDSSSCHLFSSDPRCMELLVRALRAPPDPVMGRSALQLAALARITKEFFSALPSAKLQQTVLRVLFDLLADCATPGIAQAIGSAFKGLVVDAEQVALELVRTKSTAKSGTTVAQARRQKEQQQQLRDGGEDSDSRSWRRSTLILEMLQHKKKLRRPEALVPPLFGLLERCLEASAEDPEAMEYVKQLVLACLLNACTRFSPNGVPLPPGLVDEDKFSVELIVRCVRSSRTPQTHHHALLLLGATASIFPEKVLHNIMPIFTFMGASVMRMDDAYSFQVIGKTVETVIPALIKAGGRTGADVDGAVTQVMRVFVEACPYMPEHRRAPVLVQLARTVGPDRFLWALLLLALELRVTRGADARDAPPGGDERAVAPSLAAGDKDVEAEREVEFWVTLCGEFSPAVQLTSLVKVVQYLAALPQEKEDVPDEQPKPTARAATRASRGRRPAPAVGTGVEAEVEGSGLFSVSVHSAKQLRHFKFTAVSFLSQLLASPTFIAKVAKCTPAELEELRPLEQSLLEQILCYINQVAQCVEENGEQPAARFWRAMLNRAYDGLDKVNALMPTESFVPVVRGLMGNRLPSVRRKAMELLNSKLLHHRANWSNAQVELLLEVLELLLEVCGRHHRDHAAATAKPLADGDPDEESEQAVNRQTALMSLKLLCRSFGAERPARFLPVLAAAVQLLEEGADEDVNVLAGALLCAAETATALRVLAVPLLPRLLPSMLGLMGSRKELLTHDLYLLSAITALQRVSATLPYFLSPYLLDILMQLTHVRTIVPVAGPHVTQLQQRLTQLQATLAHELPARVLLPAISRAYDHTLLLHREGCLGPLFSVLTEHLAHIGKEELASHQAELTALFTKALDFRAEHAQDSLDSVGDVEGHVITSLVAMVMKMSEVTFRPLFFKLFDWASGEDRPSERLLTFYRMSERVAERLRGLFVLFAGHLVKPCAHLLNRLNVALPDEKAVFGHVGDEAADERNQLLLQLVLDCLHKVFLYDTQRFLTEERVHTLLLPLVDQLENTLGGDDVYQQRVACHLVPCIAQFAVAMGDDTLWKPLNYQILLKTRHTSPKVRFASLLVLLEFATRLRENFTVLLPETIPFLAELMEDECEEVEKQCQKTVRELEVILGESLQSYF